MLHVSLHVWGSIAESKMHYIEFEQPVRSDKGSFPLILLSDGDLVITRSDSTAILTLIMPCKTDGKDASMEPVWNQDMGTVWAFNIAMINCVVG
jgi:hypothetical protein